MALAARVRIPVGALLDRQNGVKVALGVVGPAVQVRSLVPALLLHISRDRGATGSASDSKSEGYGFKSRRPHFAYVIPRTRTPVRLVF